MTTQLTPAQQAILAYAHQHTEGKIVWFPENIKGGARNKVLAGLVNRALITTDQKDWFIAAEGYDALGIPRKAPVSAEAIGRRTPVIDTRATAASMANTRKPGP